jgi:hypothetical protein
LREYSNHYNTHFTINIKHCLKEKPNKNEDNNECCIFKEIGCQYDTSDLDDHMLKSTAYHLALIYKYFEAWLNLSEKKLNSSGGKEDELCREFNRISVNTFSESSDLDESFG